MLGPRAVDASPLTSRRAAAQESAQSFAASLARALDDPATRSIVHAAMRDSRFNEHKLVLQDFAATPQGGRLVRGIADANGVSEATVRGWIAALPAMDFYVPFGEHRLSWTPREAVVVAASLDIDETRFVGYASDGTERSYDSRDGAPGQVVVFLHPAEPKAVRPGADRSAGSRATISDPSEPVHSITFIQPGDIEIGDGGGDGGETGGGGGGFAPSPTGTYVARLYSFRNHVGDGGIGGIELVVKHYAGDGGTKIDDQHMSESTILGIPTLEDVTVVNRQMRFAASGDTWIKVSEEDDGWFNGHDYWGEGRFGGFQYLHRFSPSAGVSHLTPTSPCWSSSAGCTPDATVDLAYQQEPPVTSGSFPSTALSSFTFYNTPAAWSVTSGFLAANSSASQSVALRNGVTMGNGWVETETDQALDGGLVLRAQNGGSYYLLAIRDDSRYGYANVQIYRTVNGASTELTPGLDVSFPRGLITGFRFEASGTTLRAYVNGTLVQQATDATFTTGQIGLRANNSSGLTSGTRYADLRWGS